MCDVRNSLVSKICGLHSLPARDLFLLHALSLLALLSSYTGFIAILQSAVFEFSDSLLNGLAHLVRFVLARPLIHVYIQLFLQVCSGTRAHKIKNQNFLHAENLQDRVNFPTHFIHLYEIILSSASFVQETLCSGKQNTQEISYLVQWMIVAWYARPRKHSSACFPDPFPLEGRVWEIYHLKHHEQ